MQALPDLRWRYKNKHNGKFWKLFIIQQVPVLYFLVVLPDNVFGHSLAIDHHVEISCGHLLRTT